jgi:hypothetical protein
MAEVKRRDDEEAAAGGDAAAGAWAQFIAPDGRPYYYNKRLNFSKYGFLALALALAGAAGVAGCCCLFFSPPVSLYYQHTQQ